MSFRIETIHAFVSIDEDDEEGVVGIRGADGWLPLVCADATRLEQLRPWAESAARASGRPIKLVRFERRVDVETIEPLRDIEDLVIRDLTPEEGAAFLEALDE